MAQAQLQLRRSNSQGNYDEGGAWHDLSGEWKATDGALIVVKGTTVTRNNVLATAKLEKRGGRWKWFNWKLNHHKSTKDILCWEDTNKPGATKITQAQPIFWQRIPKAPALDAVSPPLGAQKDPFTFS